jgi:hypothetical protein
MVLTVPVPSDTSFVIARQANNASCGIALPYCTSAERRAIHTNAKDLQSGSVAVAIHGRRQRCPHVRPVVLQQHDGGGRCVRQQQARVAQLGRLEVVRLPAVNTQSQQTALRVRWTWQPSPWPTCRGHVVMTL